MAKGPNIPPCLEGAEFHPRKALPVVHFRGPALETGPLLSTFIRGNHASLSQEEAWVAFSHPYLLLTQLPDIAKTCLGFKNNPGEHASVFGQLP